MFTYFDILDNEFSESDDFFFGLEAARSVDIRAAHVEGCFYMNNVYKL